MFIGQQSIFDNFILPSIGLDYPIYYVNSETLIIEEINKRQVNKVLMQRFNNVTLIQESEVIGILVGTVVVS